jgi:RNA polymerase sigma-70 factor (ECF subfamily)
VTELEQSRPRLVGLAYRMLGSRAEAEDVVQEVLLRFHARAAEIASPAGWLLTATARASIDRLRALSVQRAAYSGPWLPEPVVGEPEPLARRARADDLSLAFLLMLERLGPEERAAFLLHTAFDQPHAEIARTLGKSEPAVRQLLHRARERMATGRPRRDVDRRRARALVDRLLAAWGARDEAALRELLAADVTYVADGGGQVSATRRVVHGAARVSRLLLGIDAKWLRRAGHRVPALVGGRPGFVLEIGGRIHGVYALETDGERILAFHAVLNPEKLAAVAASLPPAVASGG